MDTILDIRRVSKSYGENTALNDVSLMIPRGSIYGLLGPNGAGKTTLIRIINRIIYPDSGDLVFDGLPLTDETVHSIGYLPEERGLYNDMTVGDQIIYFGSLKGMSKERAIEQMKFWFDRLGMENFGPKKVKELSKGMAQKVQFVLSIIHQPEFVIFDEVFSGFDPVNANLIKDQITYLNQQGMTVLFSSHRMENVEEICTHAAMIDHAQLVLNGKIDEIKNQYRAGIFMIESENELQLVDVQNFDVLSQNSNQAQIRLHPQSSTSDALQEIITKNTLLNFQEVIPSLNDIFVKIVTDEQN